jgi:hypothetical protein
VFLEAHLFTLIELSYLLHTAHLTEDVQIVLGKRPPSESEPKRTLMFVGQAVCPRLCDGSSVSVFYQLRSAFGVTALSHPDDGAAPRPVLAVWELPHLVRLLIEGAFGRGRWIPPSAKPGDRAEDCLRKCLENAPGVEIEYRNPTGSQKPLRSGSWDRALLVFGAFITNASLERLRKELPGNLILVYSSALGVPLRLVPRARRPETTGDARPYRPVCFCFCSDTSVSAAYRKSLTCGELFCQLPDEEMDAATNMVWCDKCHKALNSIQAQPIPAAAQRRCAYSARSMQLRPMFHSSHSRRLVSSRSYRGPPRPTVILLVQNTLNIQELHAALEACSEQLVIKVLGEQLSFMIKPDVLQHAVGLDWLNQMNLALQDRDQSEHQPPLTRPDQ